MKKQLTLRDLSQLKALADPLRMAILRRMAAAPVTTKQVADELGEKPTRLYHHVNGLEAAGLIELIETRQNRGTTEKLYRSVAAQFSIDNSLLELGVEEGETFVDGAGSEDEPRDSPATKASTPSPGVAELPTARDPLPPLQSLLVDALDQGASMARERFVGEDAPVSAVAGTIIVRTTLETAERIAGEMRELLRSARAAKGDGGDLEIAVTAAAFPIDVGSVD